MCPQAGLQDLETQTVGEPNPVRKLVSTPPPGRLEAKVTLGEKGRLVIPAAIREALGLQVGDEIDMQILEHEIRMSTRWNRMKRAQERAQRFFGLNRSLSDELIAERRAEALREAQQ